ncbi:MAG: DUF2892 domain-containing protein [Armatimonadota bacterium]
MRMECNVGGTDRIARIGIGTALLGTGILAPISKPLKVAAGIAGTVGLVTGLARYCPVSQVFHLNTCSRSTK